jgi:leucyl aminopeptidase
MQVVASTSPALELNADAIVIGIWKDEPLSGAAKAVDEAADGLITRMVELEELSSSTCSVSVLLGVAGVAAPVVAVVGLGAREGAHKSLSFRAAGAAAKTLASKKRKSIAYFIDVEDRVQAICGSMIGCQGQDIMRKELKLNPFDEVLWDGASESEIAQGVALGESVNLIRRMVNLPANEVFPESFAEQCQSSGKASGFDVEVWDEHKLTDEKCGALLAVAQGSARPPRVVIMRYNGAGNDSAPIALVGKGVTFDSGGLSLKPSAGMLDMKCDMAGAATVLGAVNAIALLGLPVNVVGLCGLAENMISSNCYRLGDVLVARNGKTIEVHNTDAEGRLVLADTLNVAEEMEPRGIVDLATLTGACLVALGVEYTGAMTNDQDWCNQLKTAAESCGELVWQLPMDEFFDDKIKSKIADIKNVGEGRWAGAITAGKFLQEFVDHTPWVHLDIAGPSFADAPSKWIDAGASGCMLFTLVELAKRG